MNDLSTAMLIRLREFVQELQIKEFDCRKKASELVEVANTYQKVSVDLRCLGNDFEDMQKGKS